ncbi:copper resistance protein NlpE [Belliella kenyensis]|uniref:Copper resistance protein NlpE n=1 Tax=Belliella kenyensis TaxID=1472724 RepID=A0ABV8ENM9_9BACT|nr:copper resistance protein NlpE [Belliella kenyensis]MCH7403183.1 copper resistance protein NlpE [Belliella kenyensis]MDN3604794.1 copper resistance protein NlpE [Belliella kenyensis]
MKNQQNTIGIFILFSFFLLGSCQQSTQSEVIVVDDEVFEGEDLGQGFIDHHNALNSLDYMGVYKGVLPCADCEGIETIIELESGNSYVKKTIYLGKKDQQVIESSGTFSWLEDGNTIILETEDEPNKYLVGENVLFHLDMDGNRITGELADNYRLVKE